MKKLLKILIGIEFILILIIIALGFIDGKKMPTAYAVKEVPEKINLKLITKAVCEEKDEHIFCHDKLFIKCDGKEIFIEENKLDNFTECRNIRINLSDIKVKGSAKFKRNGK